MFLPALCLIPCLLFHTDGSDGTHCSPSEMSQLLHKVCWNLVGSVGASPMAYVPVLLFCFFVIHAENQLLKAMN